MIFYDKNDTQHIEINDNNDNMWLLTQPSIKKQIEGRDKKTGDTI